MYGNDANDDVFPRQSSAVGEAKLLGKELSVDTGRMLVHLVSY